MLDNPPAESEFRSWTYVVAAALLIYATIPLARTLRDLIDTAIGREFFLYLGLVLALGVAVVAFANLRRRGMPPGAYAVLGLVLLLLATMIYRLREIPEEAMHVAEYALLGLLVYRALVHRVRDSSVYLLAALVVGMIGTLDEYIQWVVPSRFYELRDIMINFSSGLLAQVAIAFGLRPRLVAVAIVAQNWSRVCYTGAAALLLISLGFVNTPQRVANYASGIEILHFLLDGESMMAEYGYRYEDPRAGVFRSRFDREELRELDRERGEEVARILDLYIRGEGYRKFLRAHNVIRDPYAHEAGVHLFRREFHIDRARENNDNQAEHYSIAYRENRILRGYFPTAIERSRHRWSDAVEAEVRQNEDPALARESPVSQSLITRFSETQVMLSFAAGIVLLTFLGWSISKKRPGERKA